MAYNCNKQALHNIKGICHTYGRCSAEWNVTQCYLYGAKLMPFEIDEVMKTAQKVSLIGQAYLSKHSKSELKRKKKWWWVVVSYPSWIKYCITWTIDNFRGKEVGKKFCKSLQKPVKNEVSIGPNNLERSTETMKHRQFAAWNVTVGET